jgi:DNA-binding transcriptional ArsR family regulator
MTTNSKIDTNQPLNNQEMIDSLEKLSVSNNDIERASKALKALSHPLRLKILCILGEHEISVQDIVDKVGTSQSNISQHLAILREKEILACSKQANRVFYRISDQRILSLIGMMRELFCSKHT